MKPTLGGHWWFWFAIGLIGIALVAIGDWVLNSGLVFWVGIATIVIGIFGRKVAVRRVPPH